MGWVCICAAVIESLSDRLPCSAHSSFDTSSLSSFRPHPVGQIIYPILLPPRAYIHGAHLLRVLLLLTMWPPSLPPTRHRHRQQRPAPRRLRPLSFLTPVSSQGRTTGGKQCSSQLYFDGSRQSWKKQEAKAHGKYMTEQDIRSACVYLVWISFVHFVILWAS